ncbi:hypothetical protein FCV25MIE_14905 [Fagus crenata]
MYVSMVKKGGHGKGRGCPPKSSLLPKLNESLSSLVAQDIFWVDDVKCFDGDQERGLPRVGGNNGIADCEQVLVDPDVGLLGDAAINGELAEAQTNLGIGVAVDLGHLPFCSIKHGSDPVLSKLPTNSTKSPIRQWSSLFKESQLERSRLSYVEPQRFDGKI